MIAIIVAMDIELEYIKSSLNNLKSYNIYKYSFYTGDIYNRKVILVKSGIGKVNSAIASQILIHNFNPKLIINTGIAGSLQDYIKPLTIVIGSKVKYHDVRDIQMLNSYPHKSYFSPDKITLNKAIDICTNQKIIYDTGLILTGDDFIDTDIKKELILKSYPNALCVEMEGASICHSAYMADIDTIVIRCISDLADDNLEIDYESFKYKASKLSSTVVLNLIAHI